MLMLIIALSTFTIVNANELAYNSTSYAEASCTTVTAIHSIVVLPSADVEPGFQCSSIPGVTIFKQNTCPFVEGGINRWSQSTNCNSNCSVCTGVINLTMTMTAENWAKASKGECYTYTYGTQVMHAKDTLDGSAYNLCSSSPSPSPKANEPDTSSGTTTHLCFGFLIFVGITLLSLL